MSTFDDRIAELTRTLGITDVRSRNQTLKSFVEAGRLARLARPANTTLSFNDTFDKHSDSFSRFHDSPHQPWPWPYDHLKDDRGNRPVLTIDCSPK